MRPTEPASAFEIPYLLLTPGPLTTSPTVRAAMMHDSCTWDSDYKSLTQEVRRRLVGIACAERPEAYTAVLMQGSGTFGVEAVLGGVVPSEGLVLILVNGAYGQRMVEIAEAVGLPHRVLEFGELCAIEPDAVGELLDCDPGISHVALVHCETTTGLLNPLEEIAGVVKDRDRVLIVDAMSSFGGIPIDVAGLGIDYLISSANKCIQGVPGFSFVIARVADLEIRAHCSRSLSLDLHAQWETMERDPGKWRFTSPTHAVLAFLQALRELEAEGGVSRRGQRYRANQALLVKGMRELGFRTVIPDHLQSPIVTSFYYPANPSFSFDELYRRLKARGFIIYPGKVSQLDTFRIANIGAVYPSDIERLIHAISEERFW
jgi:2-aminoethylphosphonate-pyruvate transaminase